MSLDTEIYVNNILSIKINKSRSILYVNITKYFDHDEKMLIESIDNFKAVWYYTMNNNLKYHLHIIIDSSNKNTTSLPITSIINFINVLSELNPVFDKCLHSTCVTLKDKSWEDSVKLILNLYKPSRPLKITEDEDEINKFFHCNKIVEK